jgi:putative oxidoreductase
MAANTRSEFYLKWFRMTVPVLLMIHGISRVTEGSVGAFGEYLELQGIPGGMIAAWAISILEIAGALLIIVGLLVPPISFLLAIELAVGLVMVHADNGWFVVGGGTGGMEYSVLLILCFLLIAFTNMGRKHKSHVKKTSNPL